MEVQYIGEDSWEDLHGLYGAIGFKIQIWPNN